MRDTCVILLVLALFGCETAQPSAAVPDGAASGGGVCPHPNVWRYERPGCGAQAVRVCGSPMQDGCFRAVCTCTGRIDSSCDFAREPFAYYARGMFVWDPVAGSFGTCDPTSDAGP